MQIATKITYVGFLLAVSTLTASVAQSNSTLPDANLTIDSRLSRLTEAMQQRGVDISTEKNDDLMARGWADGRRGNWVNGARRGFANRYGGGGFVNRTPWRNGGGFYNRYGGGGFVNRGGGAWRNGGFINRW
ncbi:MAG: GrrA/OscA1 family cyclophane-containing rSAM-modified RiPP [Prochloraceae cyanobacterium]|nr:GrrA/OscA1 family cyclophane-containing rSAM-modified RiPP [Prochloraceae cyanobacterium]